MIKNKVQLFLLEDDTDLAQMLKLYIETEEFEVTISASVEDGKNAFNAQKFDFAILDVNLPIEDGFDFAKWFLNQDNSIPFIFLTARKQKIDRLKGLRLGADDYICKPFDAEELILRIRNILKRGKVEREEKYTIGEYQLDFNELKLIHPKKIQTLTRREAELLNYFIQRQNSLVKTSNILKELWGENDYFLGKSMNVFISRLRKYLSLDKSIEIINVRSEGYELKSHMK